MLLGKRIVVVMPAYHAGRTLEATWRDLPHDIVDQVVVVDDASDDDTVAVARALGLDVILHPHNMGYGANQKTCYREALARSADIVVMVHPDYQYDPRLVTAMAGMVASGIYDMVLGSRILGSGALRGGMPLWKYLANRLLTLFENVMLGAHLSEYHTGYRAYSRALLDALPWQRNSDDFVFDNQILAQAIVGRYGSARCRCRPATSPRPARSASDARCATASASSAPRCSRSWRGPACTGTACSSCKRGPRRDAPLPGRMLPPAMPIRSSSAARRAPGSCTGCTASRCTSPPAPSRSSRITR